MGEVTVSNASVFAEVLAGGRGERFWYAVKPDEVYPLGASSVIELQDEGAAID